MPHRCLIYAHWDVNGIVDPYVLHALGMYRPAVDWIVFVSTNYRVPSPELDALADLIISRDNTGFDFGSWQAALAAIETSRFDEVIFANSSTYGPLWPIERVFESPAIRGADVWGMTISAQHVPHLQSYFMGMTSTVLESPFGQRLWSDVRSSECKIDVIEAYELRWMARCEAAGLRVRALYDARLDHPGIPLDWWLSECRRIGPLRGLGRWSRRGTWHLPHNPSHACWRRVLESGVPLIKADLFSLNPYGLRLRPVRDWIERHTDYPYDLIRVHADRMARNRMAA
jgi:lipopolysaccharide biosynthesis protein